MMIQPTLNDVARLAGVSRGTVSRVLNGREDVKPATRERILAIMGELNYHPSGVARGLRLGRTRTIALLVSDISGNAQFATITHSVEDVAQEHGYTVLLGNTGEDDAKERIYLRVFTERRVDGIIMISSSRENADNTPLVKLQNSGVPCVVYNRVVADESISGVHIDNVAAAALAVEHLLGQGRRRIALLAGPAERRSFRQRQAGYCQAMEHAGIAVDPAMMINSPITENEGRRAMQQLLASNPGLDAVFAASDILAIGALAALDAAAIRVPADVAVVGFDNIPVAAYLRPALSSIDPPFGNIGRLVAQLLFEQIIDHCGPRREVVPCRLVIRASSAT